MGKGQAKVIKRSHLVERFEKYHIKNSPSDYYHNMRIFEALYQQARRLHILPLKDPLEGIDVDIRIARGLNVQKPA
ncbi:MAG: hypothetical protein COS92_00405 [Desulfobacterales bacterium CG07_land_8_20_14_0_80_52_14]|nr:MAG: hypothetical protein COS92_00405 [Desulfobacterales bacterium CG07_land_8_20_14_0_80_52_14]